MIILRDPDQIVHSDEESAQESDAKTNKEL